MTIKPKHQVTSCSSCGKDFGPGDAGYSHCVDHEEWAELVSLYKWFTMNGKRPLGSYPMVERMMDLGVPWEVASVVQERITNLSASAKDLGRWAVLSA
jgi:hypothetical protein